MKIALCIPCHGDTKAKFTACLAEMIAHTMAARFEVDGQVVAPEIKTFIVSCSLLTESRNRLVMEALNWDADYMLWMDADHIFPRDALVLLMRHNLPVVGCNYARRFNPTSPTASAERDGKMELVWSPREGTEEVAHMGLGLCLMDMRVFTVMDQKAKADGLDHFWPLFRIDPKPDGIGFVGEDVYFFAKVREAGVPVHCDHELSWSVGHISEQILTMGHCEAHKERWLAFKQTELDKFKETAE